jgi:GGDEF domain-containing protein
MSDTLRDVEADIREDAGSDETEPLREFVHALRTETDDSLRLVVRYGGDEHRVLYVRDDVEARFGDELDEQARAFALRGIGDPPREAEIEGLGTLEATLRWYEDALVATFPYREWSGVVAVFDRDASALVDAALDELHEA